MLPLHTTRLTLRSLAEGDLSVFTSYRQDPEVARYQGWDAETYDSEKATKLLADQESEPFGTKGSWHQIAILEKESNHMLGDCVVHFNGDGPDDNQAEIGFTLGSLNQGKGYGSEAISALIRLLFVDMKVRRVTATVDVLNDRSVALLERLRFRREAHYVENVWFKGRWSSEYLYALLSKEYTQHEPEK